MRTLIATLSIVALGAAASAHLLNDPGFEDQDGAYTVATMNEITTTPVTVASGDADFVSMIGQWSRFTAGNGLFAPIGTGNSSDLAAPFRKKGKWHQILPLGTVAAGDKLAVNWQYGVAEEVAEDVSFEVILFGVNEATGGEAATTFDMGLTFGGESGNSAILGTSTVSVPNGSATGVWTDVSQSIIPLTADWDYIGIAVGRTQGATNATNQQIDNFSVTFIPEPASACLLLAGSIVCLVRRRK